MFSATAIQKWIVWGLLALMLVGLATPVTASTANGANGIDASAPNSPSAWTRIGPGGASVTTLAIDPVSPATLYIGTHCIGIYKSTDSGAHWTQINTGLTDATTFCVWSLAIDPLTPTTLYAETNGGLFKSTDGGANWSLLTSSSFTSLVIHPLTPATLYALKNSSVYKSTDGGSSWNAMVNFGIVGSLMIDPVTPETLYAATTTGMYKSINGGGSWAEIGSGLPSGVIVNALILNPTSPQTLYVGTSNGLFKSSNGGSTWSASSTGLTHLWVSALAMDSALPTTVYAETRDGVFKSLDAGASWSPSHAGLPDLDVSVLKADPKTPNILYVGTPSGLFRSADGGASWTSLNANLHALYIYEMALDPTAPTTLYAGTWGGISKSMDGGQNWTAYAVMPVEALAVDPLTPSTLYAGVYLGGTYKSTNSGVTWAEANTGLPWPIFSRVIAIHPKTPSTLYLGTEWKGIYKSTNSGGGWSKISGDVTAYALEIDPQTPDILYATQDGKIYKSIDAGLHWTAAINGLPDNAGVRALAIDPLRPTTLYAGGTAGVFKSTNGAATWTAINTGLTYSQISHLAIDPINPTNLYAGGSGHVFRSSGGGQAWYELGAGLPETELTALVLDPQTPTRLYAAAGYEGVFSIQITPPAPFNKTAPANLASGLDSALTLQWEASSGAERYEYCYDTTLDDICNGGWLDAGTHTQVTLSGLEPNAVYSWQVRAINVDGVTTANLAWWRFDTIPAALGSFAKTAPLQGAASLPTTPTLQWEALEAATGYEYCYDTSADNSCSGTWINAGTHTHVTLSNLDYNTTYSWQVRAIRGADTIYANHGIWWTFTTRMAPFLKVSPANQVFGMKYEVTFSWQTRDGAIGYEFCYDAINDNACNNSWTNLETRTTAKVSGFDDGRTIYWQVRAVMLDGERIEANDGAWWSFTTGPRKIYHPFVAR